MNHLSGETDWNCSQVWWLKLVLGLLCNAVNFFKEFEHRKVSQFAMFLHGTLGPFSIDVCLHSKVMGFSGRARAFSYLLLCSDVEYDVKLLSQLWVQLAADSGRAQLSIARTNLVKLYQSYMGSFGYMCIVYIYILSKYVNSNVLRSGNRISRLLSCITLMLWTAHWHLEPGAHAKGRSNLGPLRLPRPVLQGSAGRSWWMESTIWVESKECEDMPISPMHHTTMLVWEATWSQCDSLFTIRNLLRFFGHISQMTRFISKESYCKILIFQLHHGHSSSTGHFGLNSTPQKWILWSSRPKMVMAS